MNRIAFYPALLAAYPVLYLYGANFGIVELSIAVWPMAISLVASAALLGALTLLYRNVLKAGLATAMVAFLFFSYGHVHSLLYALIMENDIDIGGMHHSIFIFKIILFGVLALAWIIFAIYGAIKIRSIGEETLRRLTGVLNAVSIALIAMPIAMIAMYEPGTVAEEEVVVEKRGVPPVVEELGYYPDIYNIILDGYARDDTHRDVYHFDNSDFLGFLESKGFDVLSEATSNYYWTFLSLASTRAMSYLHPLRQDFRERPNDMSVPFRMIRDSAVSRFLGKHGYRIVHLNSSWGATMTNPYADEEIQCSSGVYQIEFYRVLYEITMLKMWEADVDADLAECHLTNFETLKKIAPTTGPKYVFVHFVPPHHPYVFDRDGNILRQATVSNQFEWRKYLWRRTDKYIDQTVYVNKRMKEVVDAILSGSRNPPVIIIQSDHGPQLQIDGIEESTFVNHRLSILFAAHTPGVEDLFPEDLSSVNEFRYLFNHYFDAGMPVLDDEHYYSNYHRPYAFFRVPPPFSEEMKKITKLP